MRLLSTLEKSHFDHLQLLLDEAISISSIRLEHSSQSVEHLIGIARLQVARLEAIQRSDFECFPVDLLLAEQETFLALCRAIFQELRKLDPNVVGILV